MLSANYIVLSLLLPFISLDPCDAIKCFDCNSMNNSACLDIHLQTMQSIIPVVDCAQALPNALSKYFFCRKMTQTILYPDKSPEVRVLRSCGWVKHKRECYKADNKDHLETVCQCFGDMCNGAPGTKATLGILAGAAVLRSWR